MAALVCDEQPFELGCQEPHRSSQEVTSTVNYTLQVQRAFVLVSFAASSPLPPSLTGRDGFCLASHGVFFSRSFFRMGRELTGWYD